MDEIKTHLQLHGMRRFLLQPVNFLVDKRTINIVVDELLLLYHNYKIASRILNK